MFTFNEHDIALVNTHGLWYALITDKHGNRYESEGYADRNEAKEMAKILTYAGGDQ